MEIIKTSICVCLLALITACSNYNYNRDNNNRNHTNKEKPQTKEQITKELETITLFYDGSGDSSIVSLMSNGLISMIEKGSDDINTIEFTVQDSMLFFDMQRVLRTAKIDTALLIGEERIDSIYNNVIVKNDVNGYIIDHGNFKYTIPTTVLEYKELKDGLFNDIALNDTATKKILRLISWKNDIPADYMLLYQYNNKTVPNDTLCFGSSDRIVRINSYVAEVDSVLFKDITDRIRELTYK